MPYSEINALRKDGRLEEAIAMAEDEYSRIPGKLEAIGLFWCLNDYLKQLDDEREAKDVLNRMGELFMIHDRDNDVLQRAMAAAERLFTPQGKLEKQGWSLLRNIQDSFDINARKRLLLQYLQLGLNIPTLLHSRIMGEAVKIHKEENVQFAFAKFADMWGLDNFREEDWEQRQNKNGHILPSLTEKVITTYIKDMHADPAIIPSEPFRRLLATAIERYPRNLHLPRYEAQILVRDGKTDEAIAAFKRLLIRTPDKFYLWDDMASLVDDQNIKIGLLSGAVTTGALDEFLPSIRLRLADMFCNLQMYANAKTELERYQRAHETKQWSIPRRFYSVLNRIPHGTLSVDNRPVYLQYKTIAENFLFADQPEIIMVKTWEKKDNFNGKNVLSWQLRHGDASYWIKPKRFHLNFNSPNGSTFGVKLINDQVVWAQAAEPKEDMPWYKTVTGTLHMHSQQNSNKIFGFVEDVFVPGYMTANHADGDEVTVTAIINNGRWNALNLK